MKRVVILGVSGSIGMQTVDVIEQHRDQFTIVAYSVGHNIERLHELLKRWPIKEVAVAKENDAIDLALRYPDVNFYFGNEGLCHLATLAQADIVVNALVGFRGLKPTLAAIKANKHLALANKESLVAGGELVKEALRASKGILYPIDSEHSAIFQCLQGNQTSEVERLIITASGGSFRDRTREQLKNVSVEEALAHPNWKMGGRITIDSATMMNKGFEVIEAHYLFDLPYEKIDTIIHPQSIVHSFVEYRDHAVMAQLGTADMRIPIQYALTYPHRETMKQDNRLNLAALKELTFREMDFKRFPLLALAYEVGKRKGNMGAVLNGADEEAVRLFLNHEITFLEIEAAVKKAVDEVPYIASPTLAQLEQSDALARAIVRAYKKGANV